MLVYMLTFTINTPQMLAYIPAPWILWDRNQTRMSDFMQETAGILLHDSGTWMKFHQDQRIRSDPPRISLCYARTYVILCYLMLLSKKGRESKKKHQTSNHLTILSCSSLSKKNGARRFCRCLRRSPPSQAAGTAPVKLSGNMSDVQWKFHMVGAYRPSSLYIW